jgi:hypothetical protein
MSRVMVQEAAPAGETPKPSKVDNVLELVRLNNAKTVGRTIIRVFGRVCVAVDLGLYMARVSGEGVLRERAECSVGGGCGRSPRLTRRSAGCS